MFFSGTSTRRRRIWTTIHLTSFSVFLNFDDAEKQMMPKMLVQKKWEEMKVSIMEAIENLAKAG